MVLFQPPSASPPSPHLLLLVQSLSFSSTSSCIDTRFDKDCQTGNTTKQRQKKKVAFAPEVVTHVVESHKPFKKDLWYCSKEFSVIKLQATLEIGKARQSNIDIQFRPGDFRGLERLVDEDRSTHIFRSIQAVLLEQRRQQESNRHSLDENVDSIARIYQAYCIHSVNKAQRLATIKP